MIIAVDQFCVANFEVHVQKWHKFHSCHKPLGAHHRVATLLHHAQAFDAQVERKFQQYAVEFNV